MRYVKWISILLASMILLVAGLLFVIGHMPDADRFQASTEINAPVAKVWAFLDDEQNMKKWISWLQEVKRTGPRGTGSTLTIVMHDENNGGRPMTLLSHCTEYVPGSLLGERIEDPVEQFDGSSTYKLTDLGNGKTRLDIDSRYAFHQWFANLMSPLVLPAARNKLMGDLSHLKELVEKS
jgi:uncharacterized protein YndB with AHSA1/START domain